MDRPPVRQLSAEDWSSNDSAKEDPFAIQRDPTALPGSHQEHVIALPFADESTSPTSTEVKKTSTRLQHSKGWLGLHPTAPVVEEHNVADHGDISWSKLRMTMKEPFAECFGVFVMVLFGDWSVAHILLIAGEKSAPGGDSYGACQSISWGWRIGVMLGIHVAGDSGAYLNPAIRLTDCLLRKLPWRRFPIYLLVQLLGGFEAAGVIHANYVNGIKSVEGSDPVTGKPLRTVLPSKTATAGIFCTYPQPDLTKASQFFSKFIASSILMFTIFALEDDSNKGNFSASGAWFPLGLFFLIFGLEACFGWDTGYAMNLALDFGPRLMSHALGYGHEDWSAGGYYFYIPTVAPFCGSVFEGYSYDPFIHYSHGPDSH